MDHAADGRSGAPRTIRTMLLDACSGRNPVPVHELKGDPGYVAITAAMDLATTTGVPVPIRVAISPTTARWLLAGNEGNRNFSETTATKYSRDMAAGRWFENGEGFSIAKPGSLNNGQHRLVGVVHSGVTIMTIVTVGLERASRVTNDIGLTRSLSAILGMDGVENANVAAAATRLVLGWDQTGTASIRPARETSNQEIAKRLEDDAVLVASVRYAAGNGSRARSVLSPSQLAFTHYLLTRRSPEAGRAFVDALVTGADAGRGLDVDDPRYVLRERLLKDSKRMKPTERVELVIRAWNMWRRGETVSKFVVTGRTPGLVP